MAEIPPKITAGIEAGGGRHYRGRGLGTLQAWKCVACGIENVGDFNKGCSKCGAGAPGVQVRKPGDTVAAATPKTSAALPDRGHANRSGGSALARQLRDRVSTTAVDYDEIERRVARVLEDRLGGGYTPIERVTLYNALECYITLWDEGTIDPGGGLNLEQTRKLAEKIAPDEGMEMVEERDAASTTTAPETDAEVENPNTYGFEHGDPHNDDRGAPDDAGHFPTIHRVERTAPHPAPEFVDHDSGPDEGGQDDPDRDGR